MLNLLNISTDTTLFPWARRTPWSAVPALIAVSIALTLGTLTGHESAGAIAAGAAYTIGFAAFHEALASTLLSMAILTAGIASATLAGSLGAYWTSAVLILVVFAAINFGLLSALNPIAGWMGQQCAIYVIVASYFQLGIDYALGKTAMVLLGGAVLMTVHTVVHIIRHRSLPIVLTVPLRVRLQVRLLQLWNRLRNEVHFTGDTASYTLRMALTLLICTAIYRHYHVRNGYWSPMTALLVLKPQWSATLSRGIARFLGTLAGVGFALLLARTVTFDTPVIFAMIIVCAWGCYALQAVNYALFSMFTTLYIVFLFRFGGFSQTSAAHIRLFNIALGGAIALIIDAIWLAFAPRHPAVSPTSPANFVQ